MTVAPDYAARFDRLLDRILGPRDWCVVDDCMTPGLRHDNIYAVPTSRRCNSDVVIAYGLREKAAKRRARQARVALSGRGKA